jgi:hypothetical protein
LAQLGVLLALARRARISAIPKKEYFVRQSSTGPIA